MFKNFPGQPVVKDLKITVLLLIMIVALVAFSGCTRAPGATPPKTVMVPDTINPVKTTTVITPLPAREIARIRVDQFGMNPATGTIYEFVGKVQVNNGPYQSV